MTITLQDRAYFLDPIQTPVTQLPDNARLVVLQKARAGAAPELGDIIPVTGTTGETAFSGQERFWYIGEDNFNYDGALLNNPNLRRSNTVISFMGDEAVLGRIESHMGSGYYYINNTRRWSRRRDNYGTVNMSIMRVTNAAKAADWADELWPRPDDSDELVEAKLAVAKQKWEIRLAHAEVLREGIRRDWLTTLETNEFYTTHGMPRPRLGALIEGDALVPLRRTVEVADLDEESRAALETLNNVRNGTPGTVPTSVRVPVKFVYRGNIDWNTRAQAYAMTPNAVNDRLREITDDYSLVMQANTIRPILFSAA